MGLVRYSVVMDCNIIPDSPFSVSAGILTILFQLPREIRDPLMDELVPAVYMHFSAKWMPMGICHSLPKHYRASGELVKLCHGALFI